MQKATYLTLYALDASLMDYKSVWIVKSFTRGKVAVASNAVIVVKCDLTSALGMAESPRQPLIILGEDSIAWSG